MRESLHEHASSTRDERAILQDQLILLKKQLEPLEKIKQECYTSGQIAARRYVNSFAGIILGQYFLT
jgi:calcium uniporter protein, mitochondrial